MIIRAAQEDELESLIDFPVDAAVGGLDVDSVREDFAQHRMRPEWTWLIDDGERVLARALWWGRADSTHPLSLDALDVASGLDDPERLATELLKTAHAALFQDGTTPPGYMVRLPRQWQERDDITAGRSLASGGVAPCGIDRNGGTTAIRMDS